jgi:hypothetical protein
MSTIETWAADAAYQPGNLVTHQGVVYQKLDDGDQSPPDSIPGGWSALENSNVAEFNAIATSFSSDEERVRQHKADILAKLQAAGLRPDEVKAVLAAG